MALVFLVRFQLFNDFRGHPERMTFAFPSAQGNKIFAVG